MPDASVETIASFPTSTGNGTDPEGQLFMDSITPSGPGSLSGTGLSGSDGSYTLTGTAAAITGELRALSLHAGQRRAQHIGDDHLHAERHEQRL
jgi:hypothetical protein